MEQIPRWQSHSFRLLQIAGEQLWFDDPLPDHHAGSARRAISVGMSINDSWPKLRWKILFTPQKGTGVSRQKKETERFRNIDPTKNGGLGMRKPEKS